MDKLASLEVELKVEDVEMVPGVRDTSVRIV